MRIALLPLGLAAVGAGPYVFRHAESIVAAAYRGIPRRWLELGNVSTPRQQRNLGRRLGIFLMIWGVLAAVGAFTG